MDPLSHAAFGRTLLALHRENDPQAFAAAAAAIGALSPDIDAILMPFGWDIYLRFHEVGTHTIIGAFACGLLTAAVIGAVARSVSWRTLVAPAVVGAWSHVLLDLISSGRLRVLWPVHDRHFSVPLVAMADPWLASLLLAAAVALFMRRRRRAIATVAILGMTAFLLMKAAFLARAIGHYEGTVLPTSSAIEDRLVDAKWASLREWYVFDRTHDDVRMWRTRADGNAPTLVLAWHQAAESALIARSRTLSAVRNFLRVHRFRLSTTFPLADGGASVLWSDIRYCWDPDSASAPQLEPRIVQGSQHLACALWVGGEFGPDGQPVRQVVRILGFTQTRSARE